MNQIRQVFMQLINGHEMLRDLCFCYRMLLFHKH